MAKQAARRLLVRRGVLSLPLLPCATLGLSLGLSWNRCLARDFDCVMGCSENVLPKPNLKVSTGKFLQTS